MAGQSRQADMGSSRMPGDHILNRKHKAERGKCKQEPPSLSKEASECPRLWGGHFSFKPEQGLPLCLLSGLLQFVCVLVICLWALSDLPANDIPWMAAILLLILPWVREGRTPFYLLISDDFIQTVFSITLIGKHITLGMKSRGDDRHCCLFPGSYGSASSLFTFSGF